MHLLHRPDGSAADFTTSSGGRSPLAVPALVVRGTVMYLALFVMLRVVLKRQSAPATTAPLAARTKKALTASAVEHTGRLWDPVPITTATYVSKPLAPRTVRTIDLSGPALTGVVSAEPPVTADAAPVTSGRAATACAVVASPFGSGRGRNPRGYGAVGSASRSQREGQGFESP